MHLCPPLEAGDPLTRDSKFGPYVLTTVEKIKMTEKAQFIYSKIDKIEQIPGQVGLGSSRPESTLPGQLRRVKSALYIRYSCV